MSSQIVTLSRVENPLKQHRDHYETNELLLWFRNSLNQGEAGFTAHFTDWHWWRELRKITESPPSYQRWTSFAGKYLILIKKPILANPNREEKRVMSLLRHKNNLPICSSTKEDQNNIWFPQHLFILLYIRKLSSTFPRYKSVPGSERRGGGEA